MTARPDTDPVNVALICALRCEADPLIQRLRLHHGARDQIWRGDGVLLGVSGVGSERSAQTGKRLAEWTDSATCWLNFGCAGGRGAVGDLVAAGWVEDESGERWHPQFPFPVAETVCPVFTVSAPTTDYPAEGVVEMEAAGFYRQALARASVERVHVLKLLVDGPQQPIEEVTAKYVRGEVESRVESIVNWIDCLAEVALAVRSRRPGPAAVETYLDRWHFTVSQKVQLQRVLERLHARTIDIPTVAETPASTAGQVLAFLRRRLQPPEQAS